MSLIASETVGMVTSDARELVVEVRFTGEEVYFEDHFPGFPLVPGVLLFEAMREAGQVLLAGTLGKVRLRQSTRLRLVRQVRPPVTVQVCARIDPEDPTSARCEVLDEEGRKMATVRLHFEAV